MDEYPSNSIHGRDKSAPKKPEGRKPLQPVVSGELTRRKKPMGKRFSDIFLSGEAPRVAGGHVFTEVVVPALRAMVVAAGEETLQRLVYGPNGGGRAVNRVIGQATLGRFNYQGQFTRPQVSPDPRTARQGPPVVNRTVTSPFDYENIVIPTRVEAEAIIEQLITQISQFDTASVLDLKELLGISGEFTDEKYGWTDLLSARAVRIPSGGYVLDIPRPIVLAN